MNIVGRFAAFQISETMASIYEIAYNVNLWSVCCHQKRFLQPKKLKRVIRLNLHELRFITRFSLYTNMRIPRNLTKQKF